MSELIALNPTEQFLQNSGMTMTLKDIADKYGKRHNDLMDTFKLAVSKLTDENIGYVAVVPKNVEVVTGKGKVEIITSFELDLKTTLWLMTKFDENLRMDVINFAFEKLEESKRLAIIEAKKPNMLPNGMCSVRRAISEVWDDDTVKAPTESDIWDSLVWKGFARTEAKVTVARTIPKELNGHVGVMKAKGDVKYYPETVEKVWSEFCEAGKPVKSEYERLKEEFAEISKYYEAKLAEAKGGK